MGQNGCRRLKRLDLRSSSELSSNITPLLKFCDNIKFLGLLKSGNRQDDWHVKTIHNTDIEHLAVKTLKPEHFTDHDLTNLLLVQPSINKLELPGTNISNDSLVEIANQLCSLVMLNVSNCIGITDSGVRFILDRYFCLL